LENILKAHCSPWGNEHICAKELNSGQVAFIVDYLMGKEPMLNYLVVSL
jgi:hypothetical protein